MERSEKSNFRNEKEMQTRGTKRKKQKEKPWKDIKKVKTEI